MAEIRTSQELANWNFRDWIPLFEDWSLMIDEEFIDCHGNLLDEEFTLGLVDFLKDKGYTTQDEVDQLWLDMAVAAELLGTAESGYVVKAPVVFGGSE